MYINTHVYIYVHACKFTYCMIHAYNYKVDSHYSGQGMLGLVVPVEIPMTGISGQFLVEFFKTFKKPEGKFLVSALEMQSALFSPFL